MCILEELADGRLDVIWFFWMNSVEMLVELCEVAKADVADGTGNARSGSTIGTDTPATTIDSDDGL